MGRHCRSFWGGEVLGVSCGGTWEVEMGFQQVIKLAGKWEDQGRGKAQ